MTSATRLRAVSWTGIAPLLAIVVLGLTSGQVLPGLLALAVAPSRPPR